MTTDFQLLHGDVADNTHLFQNLSFAIVFNLTKLRLGNCLQTDQANDADIVFLAPLFVLVASALGN